MSAVLESPAYPFAARKVNGILGNWLNGSLRRAGLDPDNLEPQTSLLGVQENTVKAYRDLWPAGQAVGDIDAILPAAEVVRRLAREYAEALGRVRAGSQ